MSTSHRTGPAARIAPHPVSDDGVAVNRATDAYRALVAAVADSVMEYHAWRRGSEIVTRVNYSLTRRVLRQKRNATRADARGEPPRT